MTEAGVPSNEGVVALKFTVALYILVVSKMNLFPAKMFMMEKIKVAEGWIKSDNSDDLQQPFAIPFIVESLDGIQDIRDAKILCNCCICKHAFGTLHMYGKFAIKTLINCIKTGTLPIHMNLGRHQQINLFVETILPRL